MDPLTAAAVGLALAYVTVAPDRATLAVSRGAASAVRGGWTVARTEGVRAIDARAGYTLGQRTALETGGAVARPGKRSTKRATRRPGPARSTTAGPRTTARPGSPARAAGPEPKGTLGRAARAGLAAMPAAAWTGAREALATRTAAQQAGAVHLKDVARARKTEHHQRTTRREDKTMAQRTSIGSGELTSVQQLLDEVRDVAPRLEQLHTELTELGEWVSGLTERYVAADFGTRGITDGVSAVAETAPDEAAQTITALTEALQALYSACREAEIVTEAVEAVNAEGRVAGFQGQ